jgi:signal-transduction protein with cAMP-binding, CBS, and nucleotidyltransferase domain
MALLQKQKGLIFNPKTIKLET